MSKRDLSKRDLIAESAFTLFSEHGYAEVRMDQVAARAGVAKGTVYLYFDSKEALFRAAIAQKLAPVTETLGRLAADGMPAGGPALHGFYVRLATFIARGVAGTVLRLVISESRSEDGRDGKVGVRRGRYRGSVDH